MDGSGTFCRGCSGRIVNDSMVSMRTSEVIMLYDLDRARQLLSSTTLAELPEPSLSLKPEHPQGKCYKKLHISRFYVRMML